MFVTTETIEVVFHRADGLLSVELVGFAVSSVKADEGFPWRKGRSYEIADGKLIQIRKQHKKETRKEVITKWQDWIDHWAVCFDYGAVWEDRPGYENGPVFTSDWQDYRQRCKRSISFRSDARQCGPVIAVQVIDVFANEHLAVFQNERCLKEPTHAT